MSASASPPATDLASLQDEALLVLAHEEASRPAEEMVILRYYKLVEHLAVKWARRAGLRAADVPDAKQTAWLALVLAVRIFDPAPEGQPSCRFRTFLWNFVTARVVNFVRDAQRYERRLRHSIGVDHSHAVVDEERNGSGCQAIVDEKHDPALVAEEHELLDRLAVVVSRLDPRARLVWECVVLGTKLRDLANALGVSCRTARYWRQRLMAELGSRLAEHSH